MILIDVHAHLELFGDGLDAVIQRAKAAGVKKIVAQGVNPYTNRQVLDIAERYDIVEPALGIYPQDALKREVESEGDDHPFQVTDFDFDEELRFIERSKPVALGEIGLDYKNCTDPDQQKERFVKFIGLGRKLDIPLIIHSRKAEQDVIDLLEQNGAKKVILHCFSGKLKLVKRAADLGYSFSVPTNIVRSEHFQKMVEMVNISQLLTETDAPYLSPFPDRKNEPAFIIETIKVMARIKGMTEEDVANNIFMNYQRLF
ncbi:TPA: TatD family hydrolase [Candidatus Woesearchaeota archaeon]|nr:TatD family hydrolase [Candidatus Woesearchaeota archaeon]